MDNGKVTTIDAIYNAVGGFVRFVVTWYSIPAVVLCAMVCLVCLLSSCSPCERLAKRCPPIEYVRDSIVVYDTFTRETTITDTLLYVRLIPEFVYVQKPVTDTARGETSFTRGVAWVDGETISLSLTNKDSAEVLVQRIKTLERQLRESYREKETGKVREVYKTRRIVKFFAGMGIGTLIMLLIRIAVFIVRRK